MAKQNLPLQDKDFYAGKGNPFEDVIKGIEILNKALDETAGKIINANKELLKSAKGNTKETANDYKVLNETLTESEKKTAALNAINKEKEKLDIALIKANKQLQQENEEQNILLANQKKVNKELAREQLGLVGSYEKLTKQVNEAQKKFKNLAAEFGANSKQAKAAKSEFDKLDGKLRKVNAAAKDGRRDVGRYEKAWGGLKGILSKGIGLLGITAGFSLLQKGFKDVIASTQTTADQWDSLMKGMSFAYNKFVQTVATGDFSKFGTNLKKAFKDGREVAKIQDDLTEKTLAYSIAVEKAGVRINELELIRKNITLSDQERVDAAKEINQIALDLFNEEKKIKEDAYNAALKQIELETGLTKEQFEYYFDNYNKVADLQKEQIRLNEEINKLYSEGIGVGDNISQLKEYRTQLDTIEDDLRTFSEINSKYQKSNDESNKNAVESRNAVIRTESEYLQLKEKNEVQLASLQNEINEQKKKEADARKANNEALKTEIDLKTNLVKLESKTFEPTLNTTGLIEGMGSTIDTGKSNYEAEKARYDALQGLDKQHYDSLLSIFSNYATKKKALEDNLSAKEIVDLEKTNNAKAQAVTELVNTLISIYTYSLDSRLQQLQTEIDATNQKINETEQALNREVALQEAGAASNIATEQRKLDKLQQEREKDLAEQKKLQKERENIDKLTQVSALITAIANIISQYSTMGPAGVVLGLLAAAAAVAGFVTYSGEAGSAVGEEGELLTKKGTHLESGHRHSQGGNKYSSAEFEQGEAHAIFSRDATRKNYEDIKQFTNLVNSGKWDMYKSSLGSINNVIVNNDYEKLLREARTTNHILRNSITPVYFNGKLTHFNINGVMIKREE